MADASDITEILLTQRFLPEFGGSIRWMHEVYRRWPRPVEVITHDYYGHPPATPEFPHAPARPDNPRRDHVTAPNLTMDRRDIFIRDWGIESLHRVKRYARMTAAVKERLRRAPGNGVVRVHAVHAVPEVASLIPLKWRYGKRLQILSYVHGEEVTACCSSRQLKFIMRRAHRIVDVMIANSKYTQGVVSPHIDPSKVSVINPGVELSEFADAEAIGRSWRSEKGYGDRLVVLTIGRLDPRKNHAAVIDAVAELSGRFPNLLYICAGEGRARPALEKQAKERNVADRVMFTGSVDGKTRLGMYGGCDLFVMPAIRDGTDVEGFGMVFLEAGACGKACVAGKEGGQAEAVVDGETGLIVDGTDRVSVTAAMGQLLADAALRKTMGDAGRRRAEAFDWPRVVQRTVELVETRMKP